MFGSKNRVIETLRILCSRQLKEIAALEQYNASMKREKENLLGDYDEQVQANGKLWERLDRVRAAASGVTITHEPVEEPADDGPFSDGPLAKAFGCGRREEGDDAR